MSIGGFRLVTVGNSKNLPNIEKDVLYKVTTLRKNLEIAPSLMETKYLQDGYDHGSNSF